MTKPAHSLILLPAPSNSQELYLYPFLVFKAVSSEGENIMEPRMIGGQHGDSLFHKVLGECEMLTMSESFKTSLIGQHH